MKVEGRIKNKFVKLEEQNKKGLIKENYDADLILWNINDISEIPYWFDSSSCKINKVIKKGKIVN